MDISLKQPHIIHSHPNSRKHASHLSFFAWPVRIVHLCRRRSDGAFVILKEIPVEQMSRDERLAAQNECQVLKLLNHPNIIEYYENFLEDKALMIAMEYAPGKLALVSRYMILFCVLYISHVLPPKGSTSFLIPMSHRADHYILYHFLGEDSV